MQGENVSAAEQGGAPCGKGGAQTVMHVQLNPLPLFPTPRSQLAFCAKCGNNVHENCMERWRHHRKDRGLAVSCPFCRAPWHGRSTGGGGKDQYVNLGAAAGEHQHASLEQLYGGSAVWIRANRGEMSRGRAMRLWLGGR